MLTSTDPDNPVVVAATIIDGSTPANPDYGSVVRFDGSEMTACVLTGFTIKNGTGTLSSYYSFYFGGGIYGNYCCATIQNNTITDNSADYGGGLMYCDGTILNNSINENTVDDSGGGLYWCNGTIQDNTITGNTAAMYGGGLYHCDGTIQDNIISGNTARWGGGLCSCDGTIQDNTISGNSADVYGGGLYRCDATIQNNTISDNSADLDGGGLFYCVGMILDNTISENSAIEDGGGLSWCMGTIQDNIIIGNSAEYGGGLYLCSATIQNNIISGNMADSGGGLSSCSKIIQNNTICGNSAVWDGGGLYLCSATILNNAITGNSAKQGGGLFYCDDIILNNTISDNSAKYGAGMCLCSGTIINCIIWGNVGAYGPQLYDCIAPTYSCIQDWTSGGTGNINSDPLFAEYAYDTGTWTANAVYDTETFQSTLTDTGAAWPIDSLAGMLVRPDNTSALQYLIVSNTSTTITVWCDLSTSIITGDIYEIYDYHLQAGSPCIDTGDSTIFAGFEDIEGNFRFINSTAVPGWNSKIDSITENEDQSIMLIWKQNIDMGAYEYSIPYTYETFTVQSRDVLGTGTWLDVFTGNVGTWTDTTAAGVDKRFYRVYAH